MSDSDAEPAAPKRRRNENRPARRSRTRSSAATAGGAALINDPSKVPKHLRLRYWNSWEEMKLVELWRLHRDEVTTLQRNIPIFRVIYDGMRDYGFHVNSQECRRKINSMKNKYIAERKRIDSGEIRGRSEYRLYPLIQCLLTPKHKEQILGHQQLVLNQLFTKIPEEALVPYMRSSNVATVLTSPKTPNARSNMPAAATQTSPEQEPTHAVNVEAPTTPTTPRHQPSGRRSRLDGVHYVLKHHFTADHLSHLRVDNKLLAEQRDNAAKQLYIEEREYKMLESFLTQWRSRQEYLLQRLQPAAESNAVG